MKRILKRLWNWFLVKIGRKRKLRGQWTVEDMEELKNLHGFDVEQELANILVDEIEKEKRYE